MKLSIITINRNNAEGLRKTIESVVSQTYTDFEYIIIDGASTDESVDVIKEYADCVTYWVSEPDKGIYNAMNKGILKANGEYLLFLNSGDWLVDEDVVKYFVSQKSNSDIVAGNAKLWDGEVIGIFESADTSKIDFSTFFYNTIPHQASFIKHELLLKNDLYNESYKIVSDWEFFIKAIIIHNCSYFHIDRTIVFYDMQGISAREESNKILRDERQNVLMTLMPRVYKSFYNIDLECKELKSFYNKYNVIVNGKFSFLIRFIIWAKKMKKINYHDFFKKY